jgi:Mn2+/Fe2+ NRAMP family transporter
MQLYQAAAVADRGIGPDDYPRERMETIGGAIFANLISMCIIIATAAAIGGSGALSSADQAARALEPVAGSSATTLFAIGLLGASALAAAIVPLSTSYALAEAIGVERSVSRRFSEAPLFLGLFSAQILLGATIALVPGNLIDLLINTQILNGIITPIILTFILVLANRHSLLGDAANSVTFRIIATVCITIVGALALVVLALTISGWIGV